jgi:TonB family protein
MKHFLVLVLMAASSVSVLARNDFWIGNRYSVSLSFGAADLGKKNAPTPKSVPLPEYPAEMIRASIIGEVTLDYTVAADGRVSEVTVVKASREEFQKAAFAAARTWFFNPAVDLASSKPAPDRMRCKVRFSMTEEEEPNQAPEPTAPSGRGSP